MKLLTNMKIRNQMLLTLLVMATLAVTAGVIGLVAMVRYNELAQNMENAAARAVEGEQVNALVLAVVMDSRGIYMSLSQDDVAKYAVPLLKNLDKMKAKMAEWQGMMPDGRAQELDEVSVKANEFIKYRAELVRLARMVTTMPTALTVKRLMI